MEQLVFKMEVYEGPLDLLLSLIAKNKMDIRDIRISVIFDQYMAYVEAAKRMDMELAGEFITMASELMYIKSRMLLPKSETQEDPRAELVRVLMEYKTVKAVAGWLSERESDFAGRFQKDTDELAPDTVLSDMDAALLRRALERLLLRMGERARIEEVSPVERIVPLVRKKVVPVSEKLISVLRFLYRRRSAHFDELFDGATSRSEIVAIFYAVLELLKSGRITLRRTDGDITDSNIILNFNMTHQRDETEVTEDA
ncbi:MAG: segregation/condensation protein A [Clostridia bacterium]|nr:segregation/condensation protein A [Clostridia bacterium]